MIKVPKYCGDEDPGTTRFPITRADEYFKARMKEPLGMVREEPADRLVEIQITPSQQSGSAMPSVSVEQKPARKSELFVLGSLFLVTLFCTAGTYYCHARAWPSSSVWSAISVRESNLSPAQAGSRFKEYQRWVPIRKGDYVMFAGGSAANTRMVTGIPRESVTLHDASDGGRLIVLGANSFMVRTAAGGNQIIRRDEIATVISPHTAGH